MHSTHATDPARAATITADLHSLPTGRLTARNSVAHIFTADIDDLEAWLNARGGYILRQPAGSGISQWTLHTTTEPRSDGTTTPVLVHALHLDDEPVLPTLHFALATAH